MVDFVGAHVPELHHSSPVSMRVQTVSARDALGVLRKRLPCNSEVILNTGMQPCWSLISQC